MSPRTLSIYFQNASWTFRVYFYKKLSIVSWVTQALSLFTSGLMVLLDISIRLLTYVFNKMSSRVLDGL